MAAGRTAALIAAATDPVRRETAATDAQCARVAASADPIRGETAATNTRSACVAASADAVRSQPAAANPIGRQAAATDPIRGETAAANAVCENETARTRLGADHLHSTSNRRRDSPGGHCGRQINS